MSPYSLSDLYGNARGEILRSFLMKKSEDTNHTETAMLLCTISVLALSVLDIFFHFKSEVKLINIHNIFAALIPLRET
jgi:hypothetical protein